MLTFPTGLSRKNRLSGFTLIELIIVLVIVGLLTSLLTIRIEGALSGGDLRLATRMIVGEIKKLRGRAAYTHKDLEMGFDIDENRFYPVEPPEEGEEGPKWPFSEKDDKSYVKRMPGGVMLEDVVILSKGKVQEGEARIKFYANGCIERSLIHLRNEKDEVFTLAINPLTGRVTVYDSYIEKKETG